MEGIPDEQKKSEESGELSTRKREGKISLTVGLSLKSPSTFISTSEEPPSPIESPKDAVNTIEVDEIRDKVRLDASTKKILQPEKEEEGRWSARLFIP